MPTMEKVLLHHDMNNATKGIKILKNSDHHLGLNWTGIDDNTKSYHSSLTILEFGTVYSQITCLITQLYLVFTMT